MTSRSRSPSAMRHSLLHGVVLRGVVSTTKRRRGGPRDVLDLTRLQFAVVTIYHYFFVPLSISLAAIAAGLQIAWLRTRRNRFLLLTKLTGKLLIVTFAVGVVTGLVQEFQFGMGWSAFARFYGDVFGPTLAIEGMLAFFLEATFLALWYFGWGRLPRALHLA